jgi:general stress protein 26
MATGTTKQDDAAVERLLTATRNTMAKARYCWAVTAAADGTANARPMGKLPSAPDRDEWKIWFLTRRSSRKAKEILQTGRITIVYQHDTDDACVTLIGRASLMEDRTAMRAQWQKPWNLFFPGGAEDANAVFVDADIDRIELWVRGVTPEPFGTRGEILERDAGGRWSVIAG